MAGVPDLGAAGHPSCDDRGCPRRSLQTRAKATPGTDSAHAGLQAQELAYLLAAESNLLLIDVREPQEADIVSIPGSVLVPKGRFAETAVIESLPRDRSIILYCKSGARSADVLSSLKAHGLENVRHLDGGVLAWVRDAVLTRKRTGEGAGRRLPAGAGSVMGWVR